MADDSGTEREPDEASERSSSGEEDGDPAPEWVEASPGCEQTFMSLLEGTDVDTGVAKLSQTECCHKKCLASATTGLQQFLLSLRAMTKAELKVSIYTMLAASSSVATQVHDSGKGKRTRFDYVLPFVGEVCRVAFRLAYGVSHKTLNEYRSHVAKGTIAADPHGNSNNQNAKVIHDECLVTWYKMFGETLGDLVPLRVRRRTIENSTVHHFYTFEDYTLLPSSFTWDSIRKEYLQFLTDNNLSIQQPSLPSFKRILSEKCPKIFIRSPRDQVCDLCSIYKLKLAGEQTTADTEVFGDHISMAKAMWLQYKLDNESAGGDLVVLTMDYAQNLVLPSVPDTPSGWYFLSLVSVSMFGVYSANNSTNFNFIYSERRGGKGPNEVLSMLNIVLGLHGLLEVDKSAPSTAKRLVVWADNCGAQNKNSFVVWYLVMLTLLGVVEEASLKFLVKGHTKNHCDRGFATTKKKMERVSCWDMKGLLQAVETAATTSTAVALEDEEAPFKDWKSWLGQYFRKIRGLQSFQQFRATRAKPGWVACQKSPTSEVVWRNLNKRGASEVDKSVAEVMSEVPNAAEPPKNPEKMHDLHTKIRPYVPTAYQDCGLYDAPPEDVVTKAMEIKKARRAQQANKRKRSKMTRESPKWFSWILSFNRNQNKDNVA